MEKETLLKELRRAIDGGEITAEEIDRALGREVGSRATRLSGLHLSNLLYYIGGGIMFLGMGLYIGQNWENLSSALRIFFTLGAGLLFFVSAVILDISKKVSRMPDAMHFVAGFMIPGGVFVTLSELGYHGGAWGPGLIFLALAIAYIAVQHVYKNNLLLAFAVVYSTSAYLLLTDALLGGKPVFEGDDFNSYRFLSVGVVYILLGYAFKDTARKVLSGWLYGFGTIFFLGAAFALQGFKPEQSAFWEIIFPALVFGVMFLSLTLKSKSMLFFGAVGLVGYIFKITAEYFRDSLSWPLMLILAGFILIGVGYLTYYLNKTYIKELPPIS